MSIVVVYLLSQGNHSEHLYPLGIADIQCQLRHSIAPYEFKTANEIREGDFTVPEPKRVAAAATSAAPAAYAEDDTELPF